MNQKLFTLSLALLIVISCRKSTESNLSFQNIRIAGEGTTYYSGEDYLSLVELTDTSKIRSIDEFKYSMNHIVEIVTKYNDRVGAFPVLYNVVTNVAHQTLSQMQTPYAQMGRNFMNEFGKHYLRNFHSYLIGAQVEPVWESYYRQCAENKSTILHLALSGINAHITYDIPFVLDDINAVQPFYPDFVYYTDFIAATYGDVSSELETYYGVKNAAKVFHLFEIGTVLDSINGQGTTTHFVIDILRRESWQRGLILESGNLTSLQMHHICFKSFKERENFIRFFDEAKLLY